LGKPSQERLKGLLKNYLLQKRERCSDNDKVITLGGGV